MTAAVQVTGLFTGAVRDRWQGRPPSAIEKVAARGALRLTPTGFEGDVQADLWVHGGREKAVHHYPADHYMAWAAELGPNDRFVAGGFGENVSTEGLLETEVCIGDVFTLGAARVQVSQGRQPCWKLSAHTGLERMAYLVQATARTGWYYRVLEPGVVEAGDLLHLLDRPQPDWSVDRVTRARFDRSLGSDLARHLANLMELNEGWREAFRRRAAGARENASVRLEAPSGPPG